MSLEVSNDQGGWKYYGAREGNYAPELVITTLSGDVSTPDNELPMAEITVSQTTGTIPFQLDFDGSSSYDNDGSITAYEWRLNDTVISTAATDAISIEEAGSHTLSLTVTDDQGASSSSTQLIDASSTNNPGLCDGENLVYNGDFQIQVSGPIAGGEDMGGWTSDHRYLGIDAFLANDTVGVMNNGINFDLVKQSPFPGDPEHGVPATDALLFSDGGPGNPNGSTVWKQTVTGLTVGVSYTFSAYVGNALVPDWGGEPIAILKVDGEEKTRMEVPYKGGELNWERMETTFTATDSSVVLEIHDIQTSTLDDFTVTAIGLHTVGETCDEPEAPAPEIAPDEVPPAADAPVNE